MITLPGYHVLTQIYESANSAVYRGIREEDNQAVILKVLKEDYPTPNELTRYKQEYEITRSLNTDGVVKAYALEPYQRTLVIILEDFGGLSLKQLMNEAVGRQAFMSLPEFLNIAIKTAEILAAIHSSNVIHKDINPGNIVYNPETETVKIIDFGISTQLTRENPTLKNPNVLEGTLAYMSPEQTGRMNRSLDYRTDFYSLGVTFYELLTGKVPFATTDALELVHCHIAKQPVPPHLLEGGEGERRRGGEPCPKAVSDIVMKLMAKTAEERYQSAWGLKADLEECLNQLQRYGKLSEFPLGSQDISDKFQIPQKLYGRELEVETLLEAFDRVSQGTTEMMLVAGYSGIGKSVLVAEVHKPITQKRGYFISGKFDQFQRNIPYSAVVSAFAGLVRQLLTESEAQLKQWRERLLAAFGSNGQVMIDVIPEVELIVGKQPAVPDLGATESQNRFNLVFQNFIRAFCSKEHPLAIFLDDLQWADSATLKLIELMMTDTDTQYLFLIGAYRDNEVSPTHPLMMTIEGLHKERATINSITLAPLALDHIKQLIADTLHNDPASVRPLAELVVRKTEGNPFFVNEFLKTLHAENLLVFHLPLSPQNTNFSLSSSLDKRLSKGGFWQWDIAQIEAVGITDNVVELMIAKLKKLPLVTQQVLRLAACVGAFFDLNTLSIISEKSPSEIFPGLVTAVQFGVILPTSEIDSQLLIQDYKFGHDRIQQAAYALIDEAQKTVIHLQIGRLLWQNTTPQAFSDKIFEIVDHLNLGVELVTHQAERNQIAKLNLMAGQKALAATAYGAALKYFHVGLTLRSTDSWQSSYDLTLALHNEAAEAAFLSGDFEQMEQLAEVVLQQAKTVLDKVKVYEVKILACSVQNNQLGALKTALVVLNLLGITFPEEPSPSDVQRGMEETKSNLVGKKTEDLLDLPIMRTPDKLAAIKILSSLISAAYQAAPIMMQLIVLEQVNLSVKYGNAPESTYAYAMYGLILCVMGEIDFGYEFGQLALNLMSKLNAQKFKCKTIFAVNCFIKHWKEHISDTLKPLQEAYASGIETGDLEYAAYSAFVYDYHAYYAGSNLAELVREMEIYSEAMSQSKQGTSLNFNNIFLQSVLNLRGAADNPCNLVGESYNELKMLPLQLEANDVTGTNYCYTNKLVLCYLFKDYTGAIKNAIQSEKYLHGITGIVTVGIFYFYSSLASLAVFNDTEISERNNLLKKVNDNQELMKSWALNAPMNFQHKYDLIEAEKARVLGQFIEAEAFYERAIKGARDNEYIQEEALAYELAATFYLSRGMEEFAQIYMTKAQYCYLRWGATAKVKHLEAKYPQLLNLSSIATRLKDASPTNTTTITASRSGVALDLATVMKASQAISGEIVLDKLLASLMRILIENAGAQCGYLILETEGKLRIEAAGSVDSENITVFQSIPIESSHKVSSTIVNYVARSSESVVLNDATNEGSFTNDPYIKEHQPKSILCVPLINQGKLTSIVYLENNLTGGAFTPDRLEVIKVLSSSAAISIENARLYNNLAEYNRNLEAKVEERTTELAIAKQKAEVANEAKSSFLANMSHELRTPLNAILGFAQLTVKNPNLSPDSRENLGIITRSGEHLLTLINQVLDLSKIEAGRTTLNEKNFDLYRLLDDVEDMFQLKASDKGLQLMCDRPWRCASRDRAPDVPRYIRTDDVKLRQVLINLLNNALKFTSEGGVSVRVGMGNREWEIGNEQVRSNSQSPIPYSRITFEVEDTGAGIASEELDSLFEAFVQTKTGRESQEGTGLGLPISRKFVQLMGGEMSVSSQVGKGTTFKFDIKVGIVEASDIETKQSTRQIIALEPNQPRYRILIVDDRHDNRQLLIKLLNPFGFELKEASNGKEAVEIWDDWEPHLIWMDMRMPVMDGYEATKQIKSTTKGQATAIIALTASTLEEERAVVLSAGCDDFLRKPFRELDLFEMMNKHIGVRYVYEGSTQKDSHPTQEGEHNVLTAGALAALPTEWVASLKQAILNIDLDLIFTLLEQIRTEKAALADALSNCIDKFEYKKILNLITESEKTNNSGWMK